MGGGGPFPVACPVSWEGEGTLSLSFTSAPAALPLSLARSLNGRHPVRAVRFHPA